MRRRRPSIPTTAREAADYEAAGQQTLPGFSPIPARPKPGRAQRVRAQALAVTEHTAKIFQELRQELASPKAEPPLIPEAAPPAKRPVTLLEIAGHFAPWVIMAVVVSIVVFRANVTEVSYAVRITGVPKPVIVGFLAWLSVPAAAAATWLLWRRLASAIKTSTDMLVRISRTIVIISTLTLAQIPTFTTWTQSHEAARYVATSICRAVVNALTIPDFKTDDPKLNAPPRKR